MIERVRISSIGGVREAEVVNRLDEDRLRVRFCDTGKVAVVRIARVAGRKRDSLEPASSTKPTKPAPPPMMRAADLLPKPDGSVILPAPRAELRAVPKPAGPARSPKYLAFVRAKPCLLCGAPAPSHPHHHGPRGTGQKTDDYRVVPLCAADHDGFHTGHRPQLTKGLVAHAQRELLVEYVRGLEGT